MDNYAQAKRVLAGLGIGLALISLGIDSAQAGWLPGGWKHRRKITIDHSNINADLTNFPVLVKLTSTNLDFSLAKTNGYDIRFTSSDQVTLLSHERERYDSTNEKAEYWVKVPLVASSQDTDFYMYFGNESASDGQAGSNVWDSNYAGVWHMKYTTNVVEDSTSNTNHGTLQGLACIDMSEAKIGGSARVGSSGENDYLKMPSGSSLSLTNHITIELWFNTVAANGAGYVLIPNYGNGYSIKVAGAWITDTNLNYYNSIPDTTPPTGTWQYVAMTYSKDDPDHKIKCYRAGVEVSYSQQDAVPSPYKIKAISPASGIHIGWNHWAHYYNGHVDDVRISNIARSAAWIKASYFSANNSLLSYGELRDPPGLVITIR